MKFARFLQDTRAPEWGDAYIDYDGLKVQLAVIRTKVPHQVGALPSIENEAVNYIHHPVPDDEEKGAYLNQRNGISAMGWRTSNQQMPSIRLTLTGLPSHSTGSAANTLSQQIHAQSPGPRRSPVSPFLKSSRSHTLTPLHAIVSNLPPSHTKFFAMLDAELEKVETFYTEREGEMHQRAKLLRKQLNELGRHRQLFHESLARSHAQSWSKRVYSFVSTALSPMREWFSRRRGRPEQFHQTSKNSAGLSQVELGRAGHRDFVDRGPMHRDLSGGHYRSRTKDGADKGMAKCIVTASSPKEVDDLATIHLEHSDGRPNPPPGTAGQSLNPREYKHAKRKLRIAVVEHYRGLEILDNYRAINLAGFRKALKKYVKITKIHVLDAYMKERVEPSIFASGATVSAILKEMEHLFAVRFERGNKKRAINHLRVGPAPNTRHFNLFHSGLWLGLAIPAITAGIYLSFQENTRNSLPSWGVLLFIYSIFLIPILLALLVGVNVLVWTHSRINYIFIFKLNAKSSLDYREYFELPSFLLCTLAYAFWFSLARIGLPTLWPLLWLVLAVVVMLNPIRSFMWGESRRWTIRKIAKLAVSGIWTVEFADLWLGDQLCSVVYSLANLYFVGCFYTHTSGDSSHLTPRSLIDIKNSSDISLPPDVTMPYQAGSSIIKTWTTCGVSKNWTWYYLLGVLPFLARFLQSLRRYWDSRLSTQLVNAGKYGMGAIQYLFYFYWRHHASLHTGQSYFLFCFTATVNSIYACAWDYFMDWSMCKPYARYPLLRPKLVFKSQILLYYFAMLTNLGIRFAWLIYVFFNGKANIELYSFIAAMLEMLRRVQWNIYRVENKHLSNMELHRVTREPPLPYCFDMHSNEEAQLRMRKRMVRLS